MSEHTKKHKKTKQKPLKCYPSYAEDRALLFSYALRIHAQLDTTWEAAFMYSRP